VAISWTRLPFRFDSPSDYQRKLSEWVGQAFYERLPAAGYQVREEQVYFAYRVAAALAAGRPILAEAGSGTGKTFAYLLPAVCHARLHGRPVVVATATPALLEQLAGPQGDVATLSRLLDLHIDARVARRPEDVVCDIKLERAGLLGRRRRGRTALLRWAESSRLGARSEFPDAPDDLWAEVAWDPSCRCDVCPRRGFCRLTRGREHARGAADLIVCSHELFFEDTFGREALPPGRLPVLPPFSGVVFDEGHRVALAAQRAAGARLRPGELRQAIEGAAGQGVRMRLLQLVEGARAAAEAFLGRLAEATAPGEGRRAVRRTSELLAAAARLRRLLADLQDEMAIEEGLHEETRYAERLEIFHVWLDAAQATLRGLADPAMVPWVEAGDLWVAPRDLGPLWQRHLPPRTPLVFSSATLAAVGGSFAYTAAALGLKDPLTCRVGVPFRLARQVLCYLPNGVPRGDAEDFWPAAARALLRLLEATGGRALILLPGPAELRRLRAEWEGGDGSQGVRRRSKGLASRVAGLPFPVYWEGDAAPQRLVEAFRRDVTSCLVAWSLWEGIDVPGEALSAVVVPLLPLPGDDPIVEARREAARARGEDPHTAVDVPDMALRLKQGVGRLIRLETDRGIVAILDGRKADYPDVLDAVLPEGARRVRTLGPVRRFLGGGVEPAGEKP
jgi:ATP-dependent DNA helicase DinG